MRHPNPNMLVFIGIADAYASAVEYVDRKKHPDLFDRVLRLEGYESHPVFQGKPGCYTDDTEMSVANAKTITACNDEETGPLEEEYADAYVQEFNDGGRRKGYSKAFQKIIEQAKNGADLRKLTDPYSIKNGAAMRAVPMGVFSRIKDVEWRCRDQACVTHNTPEGRFSAVAVGLMSHFSLYSDRPLSEVGEYCLSILGGRYPFCGVFTERWLRGEVRDYPDASVAVTTVHAVVELLRFKTSLIDILRQCIEWGGDTDSVAAIAWGIASARYQDEPLPGFMGRDLENVYYLRGVGVDLMAKFTRTEDDE